MFHKCSWNISARISQLCCERGLTPSNKPLSPLQWRHNGHDGFSNHQPRECLLNLNSGTDQRNISYHHDDQVGGDTWSTYVTYVHLGRTYRFTYAIRWSGIPRKSRPLSTQNLCRRQLIIHEVRVLDLNRTNVSFSMTIVYFTDLRKCCERYTRHARLVRATDKHGDEGNHPRQLWLSPCQIVSPRWLNKSPNLGNVSHKQGGIAETVKNVTAN